MKCHCNEIEELRAEVVRLSETLMMHQTSGDYDAGYHHGSLTAKQYLDRAKTAEGKLAKVAELIRRDHTPEEGMYEDMGGADIVHYCAGCGVDLDDEDCPYLTALGTP